MFEKQMISTETMYTEFVLRTHTFGVNAHVDTLPKAFWLGNWGDEGYGG